MSRGYPGKVDDIMRLPLADADRLVHERIAHHRAEMARWRALRAQRYQAAKDGGQTVEAMAAELGIAASTVYEVLRAASGRAPNRRGRRRKASGPSAQNP